MSAEIDHTEVSKDQYGRENLLVWEDENADPTDRAVSFAKWAYDTHDSRLLRDTDAWSYRSPVLRQSIHHDDKYMEILVELLDPTLEALTEEITERYPGADSAQIRQELITIVIENVSMGMDGSEAEDV